MLKSQLKLPSIGHRNRGVLSFNNNYGVGVGVGDIVGVGVIEGVRVLVV